MNPNCCPDASPRNSADVLVALSPVPSTVRGRGDLSLAPLPCRDPLGAVSGVSCRFRELDWRWDTGVVERPGLIRLGLAIEGQGAGPWDCPDGGPAELADPDALALPPRPNKPVRFDAMAMN